MPYRVTGKERRKKKSELSLLKRDIRQFWYFWQLNEDMYQIYGHKAPLDKGQGEKLFCSIVARANAIKHELAAEVTE